MDDLRAALPAASTGPAMMIRRTNGPPSDFTGERAAKLVLRRETASADRIAKVSF
jgi:hypothetical protein